MTKKYLKLINDFANDQTLAKDINVEITEYCKSFKPKEGVAGAKYEDANLLSDIIMGAENLLYYLERNGYEIVKRKRRK